MTIVQLTTNSVPVSGELHKLCGLPLVSVVQPLAPHPDAAADDGTELLLDDVARCQDCLAYINHYCQFTSSGWACSLCGTQNDFATAANRRYFGGAQMRAALPELRPGPVEAFSALHIGEDADEEGGEVYQVEARPVCVALVDTCSGPDFLELVRSALLAALETLPPSTMFGLVSFGSQGVALYEPMQAGPPCVSHIATLPKGAAPTTVDLADAVPLHNLLTPLGESKAAIAAALEALTPDSRPQRERPLGEALQAVLRYLGSGPPTPAGQPEYNGQGQAGELPGPSLSSLTGTGVPGARLLVFLAGPPNVGRGSTLQRLGKAAASSGGAASAANPVPFLMDPYFPELTSLGMQQQQQEQDGRGDGARPDRARRRRRSRRVTAQQDGWRAAAEGAANLTFAAAEMGMGPDDVAVNWAAAQFYNEAATAAAALSVCVDLYAACPHFVGLEIMRAVPTDSGGILVLYPSLDEEQCALPQDLYKSLSERHAFGCLLRLRTSPELQVAGEVGKRLEEDAAYDDLFHLAACHPQDAFALELEHATRSGFASKATPVVQMVLQYMVLESVPPASTPAPPLSTHHQQQQEEEEDEEAGSGVEQQNGGEKQQQQERHVLRRRVRIMTQPMSVAHAPGELYASANAAAIAFALVARLTDLAESEGMEAAQAALVDWLVGVAGAYHEWAAFGDFRPSNSALAAGDYAGEEVDPSLSRVPALTSLPRLAFALMQGQLFGAPAAAAQGRAAPPFPTVTAPHPDAFCALRTLCETLPPAELLSAICPQLSSWAAPDQLAAPLLPLATAALAPSPQPIYLLDNYSCLVVFYAAAPGRPGGAPPFPPPHGSALRTHLNAVRQARRLTPRLLMAHAGEEGAVEFFRQWLIEDGTGWEEAGGEGSGRSAYADFLAAVKEAVEQPM